MNYKKRKISVEAKLRKFTRLQNLQKNEKNGRSEKMGQEEQKKLRKEIKDRLEEYLQNLGIDVRKKFRCLNPEHEDENPSMSYDKKRKKVHCFSCLADYDIFDVMEIKTRLHGKELFEYGYEYFGVKKNQKVNPLEVKPVKVEGEGEENLQKNENFKKRRGS